VRVVLRDGVALPDPAQREPGRGAYVHDDAACRLRAVRRGGLARAFRSPVERLES